MIKLSKQATPAILISKKKDWTDAALEEKRTTGKVKANNYTHAQIKAAVMQDCYGKCMYCEAKITANNFGDVEHIKPKAVYTDEMYDWDNLGFVCNICNNNKSDTYDEALPPINPFAEEPSQFLHPVGACIYRLPGNRRGELTEKLLKLNRPELIEKRRLRIETLNELLDKYASETNPTFKDILKDGLLNQLENDKEFVMVSKALVLPML